MVRPPSKGRQKIEICPIEDVDRRQVTLSKRKSGLFKKASELALLCGAHVAVVVFSSAAKEKVWALGSPSVDHVIRRFALLPSDEDPDTLADVDAEADRAAVETALRQAEETKALVAAERARMDAIGEKVLQAAPDRQRWWEADAAALGEAELPEFARALQRLRFSVQGSIDKRNKHG